jgi:hypothetical protein
MNVCPMKYVHGVQLGLAGSSRTHSDVNQRRETYCVTEEGRIFRRVLPQTAPTPLYAEVREEKGERWIEDVYIQAQSFWHSIERDTLAQCRPTISARDMPTIAAIVFLGVGCHESYGRVEHKHLCRPATDEELQQPEPEPSGGILELLRDAGRY